MAEVAGRILVVDDDAAVRTVLAALLVQAEFEVFQADSTAAARAVLERVPADLVITDLRMPGEDGMQLLQQVAQRWPEVPVIVLTAHGTVPLAVEAMRHGAFDFALKPFDREGILFSIQRALRVASCRDTAPVAGAHKDMLGTSASLEEARTLLRKAARANATVLVRGESGTGKELAARAIHDQGPRREGPFVKVHCAALPEALLESELFGYEKGAFTGATLRKPGRVELAEGGTLFLDEIGEISLATQVKLLRLLQDKQFERLGGTQTLSADVRFVTATHRNLEEMVERGEFREDLFYRLNVIPIWIPPLRDRRDDIAHLATAFCASAAAANGRGTVTLDEGALEELRVQQWPGNVRQLQNFVERLVVLGDAEVLTAADVRQELSRESGTTPRSAEPSAPREGELAPRVKDAEREAVKEALRRARDNRTVAARLLGVSRRTLYNKLRELGLE